ncbi:uncharacterized protein LOC127090498 [Lathyrus oleraceus]|uniref:uncharacterized protein LOC127090498 n=1 Tax=Pisum sativum TaxID=3888 RepID=UPI0021CEE7DF|nr:uncharacterized protein LOC127090498 [Pisum sativum]
MGPTCYEDIKYVSGKLQDSFKDACFEMRFLNDDKEYVAAINEAKDCGSSHFLRKLFVTMLLFSTINRPRQKKIILIVGSSGIASLLLPGGRTTHSKFKMPVPTLDNSTCNIDKDTKHSQLFEATNVIIWDEAPMSHKNCFKALDKTLKDVMSKKNMQNTIFGGKVVVFGGDFRQILPVVPRVDFKCGDGKICESNDGLVDIEVPHELLISSFDDPIRAIVNNTYSNLLENYKDVAFLQGKTILASTIEIMDKINHYVLDLILGQEKEYMSFDSIDRNYISYSETYEVLNP